MNFYGNPLGSIMARTTEEKLQSIEKQLADNVYPAGSAWHQLLVHLREVYFKELTEKTKQ